MAFWQENFGFIKDVYECKSTKMVETMDECDKSVAAVLADKIYPLKEFKMVKEHFLKIAKNVEDRDVQKWLQDISETLVSGMDQKTKEEERAKIDNVLGRLDNLLPKVKQTKQDVDSLWKAYQYTDELSPHIAWLNDKAVTINKVLNTNSATETEKLIERQEKIIDQLDKKRKAFLGILQKAAKLISNPKSPEFLAREVGNARKLWDDTNNMALDQLETLKENQEAWERYEEERNELSEALVEGEKELSSIKKIYDVAKGVEDYTARVIAAAGFRKDIEQAYKTFSGTKKSVQALVTDDVKGEIDDEVYELQTRTNVNDQIDATLKEVDEFNKKLKDYLKDIIKMEAFTKVGRARIEDLLNTKIPLSDQDKVVMTMELGDDIGAQMDVCQKQTLYWMSELAPMEDTPESLELVSRMGTVNQLLSKLTEEVDEEAEKYGEDVKHLAEVTNCNKKFEPWVEKNEKKIKCRIELGSTPEELHTKLGEMDDWKTQSDDMKKVLDDGNAAAHRMNSHEHADEIYAIFVKRWEVINGAITGWIPKMESILEIREKQVNVADKIQFAITDPNSGIELKDLEALFAELRRLMVEKQKIVQSINPLTKEEIGPESK